MKATRLAILGLFLSSGCTGSAPSTPSPNPPPAPGFTISGTVYEVDSAGQRPVATAIVEIADSATGASRWGAVPA